MKEPKAIDRSFQNHRNEVLETDVPRSGENNSYRSHVGGLALGRLYPQSYQHLIAGSKFNGSNEAKLFFEKLSTPVMDTVDICVHNFLVTKRSVDNRFEKLMTPTKLNNMGAGITAPMFDFGAVITSVCFFLNQFYEFPSTSTTSNPVVVFDSHPWHYKSLSQREWAGVYHSDSIDDLILQIETFLGITESRTRTFNLNVGSDWTAFTESLRLFFDFFVGKRSLFDYLGYFIVNADMFDTSLYLLKTKLSTYADHDTYSIGEWLTDSDTASTNLIFTRYDWQLQNEYALRAYYAIWFEYYRNYDLEPRSNILPEYRDFNGSTIFGVISTQSGINTYDFSNLHYCVPRIRSWQEDKFTTAGIDDISRHVFAPVLNSASYIVQSQNDATLQPSGIFDNNVVMQQVNWRDPSTNQVVSVDVPVPSRLSNVLRNNIPAATSRYGLELFSLRKAQMLENYLKRIYYGGDEYRDRMLHLYGARIEDYRINRPQWLSSSLDTVSPQQEVANTGIAPTDSNPSNTPIGTRIATATGMQSGSDGFTEFTPEFSIYISMLSIMPHATYDPYCIQNMEKIHSDFPIPEFANSMEDVISSFEISRGHRIHSSFGYAPYGHGYRGRVDEVHGDYLDTKYDYCFLRFFGMSNVPNLSWSFIHCRPKLPMFVDSVLLNGQVYGTVKHNFLVEHPLPSPVETI